MQKECRIIVEVLEARIQELRELGLLLSAATTKLGLRHKKGKGERDSGTKTAVTNAHNCLVKLLGRPGKPLVFESKLIDALSKIRERTKGTTLDATVEALFEEAEEKLTGKDSLAATRQQEGTKARNDLDVPDMEEDAFIMLQLVQESELEALRKIQKSLVVIVLPAVESILTKPMVAMLDLNAEMAVMGTLQNALVILDANFAKDVYVHCAAIAKKKNRGGFQLTVQTPPMLIPKSVMDELAKIKVSEEVTLLNASYRLVWEKIAIGSGGGVLPFDEKNRTANAETLLEQLWNDNRNNLDPYWRQVRKNADGFILLTALARSPLPTRVLSIDHMIVRVITALQGLGHPVSLSSCRDVLNHGHLAVI
ncbi:MAG: hypothetical protein QGH82_02180 [Candidatus Woesearchaeota archaeon]|nr:hypothetical protein [Candidatus Woesearchaeota archaeon]